MVKRYCIFQNFVFNGIPKCVQSVSWLLLDCKHLYTSHYLNVLVLEVTDSSTGMKDKKFICTICSDTVTFFFWAGQYSCKTLAPPLSSFYVNRQARYEFPKSFRIMLFCSFCHVKLSSAIMLGFFCPTEILQLYHIFLNNMLWLKVSVPQGIHFLYLEVARVSTMC